MLASILAAAAGQAEQVDVRVEVQWRCLADTLGPSRAEDMQRYARPLPLLRRTKLGTDRPGYRS